MPKPRLYFDFASTTPLLPEAREAMLPYLNDSFGNAGSLHSFGQDAIRVLDKSREVLANLLGTGFRHIIFTSSATEANNLSLRGTVLNFSERNKGIIPHIISTAIEHESVLETLRDMEKRGSARITILPVDKKGLVDPWAVKDSITEDTALVSVIYANNEIGTIQSVPKIGAIIKAFRGKKPYPLFHTDAVQAFQFLDCNTENLGVDLMTISSHKIYGPKGAAALYVREPKLLGPLLTGGNQEFGLRSGTENIPAIVGFSKAAEIIIPQQKENYKKMRDLVLYFLDSLKDFADFDLNGPSLKDLHLPNIINIYFPGRKNEEVLAKLDMRGIAVSAGSACNARSLYPSHVLIAIGLSEERIKQSIRISLGVPTTKDEISSLVSAIKEL